MEYEQIKDLIQTFVDTDIQKLDLEYDNLKISLDRNKYMPTIQNNIETEMLYSEQENTNMQIVVDKVNENELVKKSYKEVTAPIVGCFYKSSSPEAKPFVQIGDSVKSGQVVCVIEAMKVINEITSEYDGTVVDVLVADGELVEYGQPIIVLG